MIFDWALFIPVFIAALFHMLKPGPFIMTATSFALAGKWQNVLLFSGATIISGTLTYFLLLGGLTVLPASFGMVFIFLKAAAAILFVTLGMKGLYAAQVTAESGETGQKKFEEKGFVQTVLAGFFLSLSNPFDIIFIMAGVPALVGQVDFTFWEILTTRLAHISAHILVVALYCVPILLIRQRFDAMVLQKIKFLASFAMIGIGLYVFINMLMQGDLKFTGLLG